MRPWQTHSSYRILNGLFLAAALVSTNSVPAQAQTPSGYALSVVAKTGDTIGGQTLTGVFAPAISDNGIVVFIGRFVGGQGIFTPFGLLVRTGDTIGGKTLTGIDEDDIVVNNSGTVVFGGSFTGGGFGIFTQSGLIAQPGDIVGGLTLTGVMSPDINNSGAIVFDGFFPGGRGIFTPSGVLAKTGDIIGGHTLTFVARPDINDSGMVKFDSGFSGGEGIFTLSSVLVKVGDTIDGETLSEFPGSYGFNDLGTVAFISNFSDGGQGIVTQSSVVVRTGDTIGGQTFDGVGDIRLKINNRGTVAFHGGGDTGAILTQSNLVATVGNTIGAETISLVLFTGPNLNDVGDMVFRVQFASGSVAVVLAQPVFSVTAAEGENVSVSTAPATAGQAGVAATLTNNTGGSGPATLTLDWFLSNPGTPNIIDVGGGFVDVMVTGADPTDSASVSFYYSSSITGATETSLQLLYFTGSTWELVRTSGGLAPVKNTTNNLDGTVSGGRFSVVFDNTSTPRITELTGTVFAHALPSTERTLTLGLSRLWIGLKSGGDQNARFDLRVEVHVNGSVAASGLTRCITGIPRNPNDAQEALVSFSPSQVAYHTGDVLSLKVLTRVGTNANDTMCPGQSSANGLRLYYDSVQRQSRAGLGLSPNPVRDFYLHSSGSVNFLDAVAPGWPGVGASGANAAPTATARFKDSPPLVFSGSNAWKEIGTWRVVP